MFEPHVEDEIWKLQQSRYYELDDNCYPTFLTDDDEEMDLFAFIHHADPTKVRIQEKDVGEGEVLFLKLTRDRVVLPAGVNGQRNHNEGVQDGRVHVVNKESGDAVVVDQIEGSDYFIQDEGVGIVHIEDEVPAAVAEKAKGSQRKRKAVGGTSGSSLPPRNQGQIMVGVVAVAMLPFVTSSVSLTPEHEGVAARILSNDADVEVSSVVGSLAPKPPILTTVVVTTVVADVSFVPVPRVGSEPVQASIFADFTSVDMDSETMRQIYVPKWNVLNESGLDDPDMCHSLVDHLAPTAACQTCLGAEVRMRLEHTLREKKNFEGRLIRQTDFLKEMDAEVASLKAQLSLKEDEAVEAIRLCGQVASVEAAKATRISELNALKERNSTFEDDKNGLEHTVVKLKSADAAKVTELASLTTQTPKLTQELFELGLSYDELSIEASSLHVERDRLVGQVSMLEGTCSELRDEVSGYRYAGWLAASIDHGKAERGLADVAAYDPSAEANFVSTVNTLHTVDFPLLAQLTSHKDVSIADIMGSLHLEGPAAETSEAKQLQPSLEHLMLPIHRPEGQVFIRETSLSFYLDVVHSRVQRIQGDAVFQRLSISEAMIPLIEPLSAENLINEASTSKAPVTATTTDLSTTFVQTNSVPLVSVADHGALCAGPSTEVPSSSKIMFEKEELDTTLEHTTTP
ncbi:hypothetical protein Tco_1145945 [Tanacetum coccineum]